MEAIAQLLFLWAGARAALAGAWAPALGAWADLAAAAMLALVMAGVYGTASYLLVRRMRADRGAAERRERAAAEAPSGSAAMPTRHGGILWPRDSRRTRSPAP